MEAFDDIDNMTIERFYNNYLTSNGDKQYRLVVLGVWSVDIKERLKIFTDDPDNTSMHRIVVRGSTHQRQRPQNSRFVQGSVRDSLIKRKISDKIERNWIGEKWKKEHNNNKLPSLNQIEVGLVMEAMVQIQLAMGKISEQQHIVTAKANIKKTWEDLLAEAKVQDRDAVLEISYSKAHGLSDPYHPVTTLCLFIY